MLDNELSIERSKAASSQRRSLDASSGSTIQDLAWREFDAGMGSVAPRGAVLAMEHTPLYAQRRDTRETMR